MSNIPQDSYFLDPRSARDILRALRIVAFSARPNSRAVAESLLLNSGPCATVTDFRNSLRAANLILLHYGLEFWTHDLDSTQERIINHA